MVAKETASSRNEGPSVGPLRPAKARWPRRRSSGEELSARTMTLWLMSAIAPNSAASPPVLSKDLELLRRAISSVVAAVDAHVITDEEADAVIGFIAQRFTARRFDEFTADITLPRHGAWFALHGHVEK